QFSKGFIAMGIFKKINFGLSKTRNKMAGAIDDMLDSFDEITDDLYTELEEILVMGDVGVTTAVQITEKLREETAKGKIKSPNEIRAKIKEIISDLLYGGEDMGLITVPSIILVIGVNGVGKTTTIGKMAAMYKAQGKKVIMGAADTFRAAAIDQLQIWADRAGVDIIKHKEGADPAAVVFDTINAAKARDSEIIIIDTAGRLHNKKNLMDELNKIYRVIDRELPYSDREVLLVLDATTGQNAVNQAREFQNVAEITGIVLTKLDGTARGGVVLAIKNELGIPVKFIGVGEQIDDLQPFNPTAFADGLFDKIDYREEDDRSLLDNITPTEHIHNTYDDLAEIDEAVSAMLDEMLPEAVPEVNEEAETEETDLEDMDIPADDTVNEEENAENSVSEDEEEPTEEETQEDDENDKKKEKRGFFGLFNRHS
ncbi:MAG: signal recognition particle-docking protein FtsY, partial [Oscillospiraceae bacterium]|nr:signal recognition particle-docking protein FtsY [Oscillospiraceae bacterium]